MSVCACHNWFFFFFSSANMRWEHNATHDSLFCDYTKITKFSNKAWKLASNTYGWSVNAFLFCFAELSYSIWSFSGRIWAVVCGWRESAGSDASTCGGRDSPCVQQQGQGPDGFRGEGPHGLCSSQQPCRTCWLTSVCLTARQALKKKHRNATIKRHNHGQQSKPVRWSASVSWNISALPDGDYPSPCYEIFRFIPRLDLCQNW